MTQECMTLSTLKNTDRPKRPRKLLGRGPGSGKGKTSGRGHKGQGARSGYKVRYGTCGGGVPLHKRVPTRGFSNVRFARKLDIVNLDQIEGMYVDGEIVSLETLRDKSFISGKSYGVKILAKGNLTKKVEIKVESLSAQAKQKLEKAGISAHAS